MGQGRPPATRGASRAYVVGLVWCLDGLGFTVGAIISAFIQVSDKTPVATTLFIVAFLMSFPTIVAIIITQLSRYGAAVRGPRGVRVPMRGPYLFGEVAALGAAALVALSAIAGHADAIWNRGGWSLVVALWPVLVFLAALDVLNGASYPG